MLANEKENFPDNIDKDKINRVALKTFFNICKQWGINNHKDQMILLGLSSESTFYKWKNNLDGKLNKDTLERISYMIGIYKALQILLPYSYNSWVKTEHPLFDNNTPLQVMLKGNVSDLFLIRNYLDAERGSLYE